MSNLGSYCTIKIINKNEPEIKIEKTYMNFECEKLPVKFYKYMSAVHKRETNLAVKYYRRIGMMVGTNIMN